MDSICEEQSFRSCRPSPSHHSSVPAALRHDSRVCLTGKKRARAEWALGGARGKMKMGSCLGYVRGLAAVIFALLLLSSLPLADAALVPFKNCLDDSIVNSDPRRLQFVPLHLSASVRPLPDSHKRNLTITVFGNVTGLANPGPYPPPDDPQWSDPHATVGKIVDVDEANAKFTTLFARLNLLSFTPYSRPPSAFCSSVTQGECPLGPVFNVNE